MENKTAKLEELFKVIEKDLSVENVNKFIQYNIDNFNIDDENDRKVSVEYMKKLINSKMIMIILPDNDHSVWKEWATNYKKYIINF